MSHIAVHCHSIFYTTRCAFRLAKNASYISSAEVAFTWPTEVTAESAPARLEGQAPHSRVLYPLSAGGLLPLKLRERRGFSGLSSASSTSSSFRLLGGPPPELKPLHRTRLYRVAQ